MSEKEQQTQNKHNPVIVKVMKFLIPLVVTVGLCWVLFRDTDIKEMWSIIQNECNFWWIALALCLSVVSNVIRALRWNIQLVALGIHAPLHALVYSIFGTYAINLVFPRLGEVWRTGYIAQRQKAPFSTVFGSMIADRLSDTVVVLMMVIGAFLLASKHLISYAKQNEATYEKIASLATSPWLWVIVAACCAAAWWLLTRKAKEGSVLYKVHAFVKGLWGGFSSIATMRGKGKWLFLTLCLWSCYFTQMFVAFFAFPFTTQAFAEHGITVVIITYVLSSVAMGVPSNGGIGPWQWAVIFSLGLYGVGKTDSAAFANLVLGTQTILLIVLGLYTFIAIMVERRRNVQPVIEINNQQTDNNE